MRDPDSHLTHVLDLPQLHTKPPASDILQALDLLKISPHAFTEETSGQRAVQLQAGGICRYLTSVVGSSLSWIDSDSSRESIWDAASARLCERAGRNAMPSMSREFTIPLNTVSEFLITLHEPSLTSDNLGNKTWVSSYLLSKRLHTLHSSALVPSSGDQNIPLRSLELGAGTGLVGISFAAIWGAATTVHLTDLPPIVPNLTHNVSLNNDLISETGSSITTGVLDWSLQFGISLHSADKYDVVLVADPLYSPDHPRWLAQAIEVHLSSKYRSRLILELPLREVYLPQVYELKKRLHNLGLRVLEEGEEIGYDDWATKDGLPVGVRCWWSVWAWEPHMGEHVGQR
ncbi:Protein-lysine N-methyltransferase rrg1 [Microsporum audouinii]